METSIFLSIVGFIVGLAVLWGITQHEIKELKLRCYTLELWISTLRDVVTKQIENTTGILTTVDEMVELMATMAERSNHERIT